MFKKRFGLSFLVIMLGLIVVLSGCGNADNQGSDGDAANNISDEGAAQLAEGDISGTIRLMTFNTTPPASTILDDVIEKFEEKYPDVEVELIPSTDYWTKLTTMIASKDYPDLIQMGPYEANTYYQNGALMNLQQLLNEESELMEDIFPSSLANFRENGDPDGDVIVMPESWTPKVIYYNKTMFEEAGLEEPLTTFQNNPDDWNFDYYKDIAGQLTIDEDGDGVPEQFGAQINFWWTNFLPWMWSFGGDFLTEDASQSAIQSDENLEMFQYIRDFVYEKNYAPTAEQVEQFRGIHLGKVATVWNGAWEEASLKESGIDYGIAPPLKGPGGRYTSMDGNGFGIHPETENLAAAWAFLKFRSSEEIQKYVYEEYGALPISQKVMDEVDIHPAYMEALKTVQEYPAQKTEEWSRMSSAVAKHWQTFISTDQNSIEEGVDGISKEINNILK